MSDHTRASLLVTGSVQGVFYRASAADEAQRLGLTGWVRNLPNGSVEAVAEGPRTQVDAFVEWCRRGPPAAKVTDVTVRYGSATGEFRTFTVER